MVRDFVQNYDQTVPTQPLQTVIDPVAVKPRRFKMHQNTKLLLSKVLGVKKCTVCFKKTTFRCSRSDAYICSVECQQRVDNPEDKEKTAGLVGKRYLLVGYTSVQNLLVRDSKDQESYIRMMNDIAMEGRMTPFNKANVSVGQQVLAFFKNHWYRGTVTAEVKKKKIVRVSLPDLDTVEVFHVKQLKIPSHEFDHPATVVKCTLTEIIPTNGLSYECEKILEKLVADQTPLVSYSPSLDEMVFKVDHVGGQDLAEMLNKTLTMTVNNDGPSYFLTDLPANEVADQEKVPMIVTDLSDCDLALSLAHGDYFKRCFRYESHFQEFAEESTGNYTPRDKELCLVRMKSADGKTARWLRAFGLLNEGDRFPRFELLDYGGVVKVNIADIRKIPKELLYPAATWAYTLQGELMRGKLGCPSNNYFFLLETMSEQDKQVAERLKEQEFNLYPITIAKIYPPTMDKPMDTITCPDLMRSLYELAV